MRTRTDAWTARQIEPGVWQVMTRDDKATDEQTFENALDAWDRADELNEGEL